MAIFHLNLKTIGRSQGRSATGSAAYRAGEVIHDRRTGLTFDYTRKKEIDGAELIAPSNSPGWTLSRAELWNRAEEAEKRKDAQVCREVEFALPIELTPEQNKQLARDFLNAEFVALGMVADVAFHKLTGQNPHAHALLTMRTITPEGFGPKVREWNDRGLCDHWRERWAHFANQALAAAGQAARIDHRTLAEQALNAIEVGNIEQAKALDRAPTIHEGRSAAAVNHNKTVQAANLAGLDAWEAIEREAMAEARLMAAYSDLRPQAAAVAAPIPAPPTAPLARRLTAEEADAAFRAEMTSATGLKAINWRAAEYRQHAAAAWLAAHKDDERTHRKQVETAAQCLADARKARQHFDANTPEPWGFWIFNRAEREDWQRQKRLLARAVRKTKEAEALARQEQAAAVAGLDAKRQQQLRAEAHALTERRGLGLLPSEQMLAARNRAAVQYEIEFQRAEKAKKAPTRPAVSALPPAAAPTPPRPKPKPPGPR
jgi:hypothetical protein